MSRESLPHSSAAQLDQLCQELTMRAVDHRTTTDWPAESLKRCADQGVYRWFLPIEQGGLAWDAVEQTRGYLRLAEADLVTTFVITQLIGAIKRIAGSEHRFAADQWLEKLLCGDLFGTVGISHLTTSGRHLQKPPLQLLKQGEQSVLQGVAPWVTGAAHADLIVVGAVMENGEQVLAAVPTDVPGIRPGDGAELVALSASCTDKVFFDEVPVDPRLFLAGPQSNVLSSGKGGTAGGLQTSTLALGLAKAAIQYLRVETQKRDELDAPTRQLAKEAGELEGILLAAVSGESPCDAGEIRGRANHLVMRATQAAMTAAKGAGFIEGHPVGRWSRQALFFLVWSCPQPVAQAHLCDLAGIQD